MEKQVDFNFQVAWTTSYLAAIAISEKANAITHFINTGGANLQPLSSLWAGDRLYFTKPVKKQKNPENSRVLKW